MERIESFVSADDGVRLFVQMFGEGDRTVVIPNGFHLLEDVSFLARGRRLVIYDVRNRGRSDAVADSAKPRRGILDDVDDLDAIRKHVGADTIDLIGHSYMGLMIAVYAMTYGHHVTRAVQIGPMEMTPRKVYPAHLTGDDDIRRDIFARLAEFQKNAGALQPIERCHRFWSILSALYVTDPANAHRIRWGRCDLPNERGFMKYWLETLIPSMKALGLESQDLSRVTTPILTIHGTRDRSAPYGGGLEWAKRLGNARPLTVPGGGHAPWIEAPEVVFGAIATFLDGRWPESTQAAESLEPPESESPGPDA
jgi:pimeloyl-ACP methyl ester carboxylesterase